MEIKRDIVSNGHGSLSPIYFAIHSTAVSGAPAKNLVTYWKREPKYAVHYTVDWDEAYQCVDADRLCWQVGNGNRTCIGIEICEGRSEDEFMRSMRNAREVIWQILEERGWGLDRLRSHYWFTKNYGGSDHVDPIPYLNRFGKDWDWFMGFMAQCGSVEEPKESEEDMGMQCIIQPNDEPYLGYYDGVSFHPAEHPDEIQAVQMVAEQTIGKQLPMFKLGTSSAPWASRFLGLISRVQELGE